MCGRQKVPNMSRQPFRQGCREAADQTDSRTAHILKPLDDACGCLCCFLDYSNGERILSPVHNQGRVAQIGRSRREWPSQQSKRFWRDPTRNAQVWLLKAPSLRLAHRRPKVHDGVLPDPCAGRLLHPKLRHRIRQQQRAFRQAPPVHKNRCRVSRCLRPRLGEHQARQCRHRSQVQETRRGLVSIASRRMRSLSRRLLSPIRRVRG